MKATLADAKIEYQSEGSKQNRPKSKVGNYAYTTLVGLAALWIAAAGVTKLLGAEFVAVQIATLHYGWPFTYFIGVCELAGGIGLLFRPTRIFATIGLSLIMAGAIGSHLGAGEDVKTAGGAILGLTLFSLIFFFNNPRRVKSFFANKPSA